MGPAGSSVLIVLGAVGSVAAAVESNLGDVTSVVPFVTPAVEEGPVQVLYYNQLVLGFDTYNQALIDLGWQGLTTTTNDGPSFGSLLALGGWTHVISNHPLTSGAAGFEGALVNYALANPNVPVLISDWRVNDFAGYYDALGLGFAGGTNFTNLADSDGPSLFDGLPEAGIFEPGWGIHAVNVTGTPEADANIGGLGITSGVRPNWFFNGPLADTWADPALGSAYIQRELLIPEPTSMLLLAAGGSVLVCRPRRRGRCNSTRPVH